MLTLGIIGVCLASVMFLFVCLVTIVALSEDGYDGNVLLLLLGGKLVTLYFLAQSIVMIVRG